jgi:hypothetical protein
VTKGKTRWSELLEIDNEEWRVIDILPFKLTTNSKLQFVTERRKQ